MGCDMGFDLSTSKCGRILNYINHRYKSQNKFLGHNIEEARRSCLKRSTNNRKTFINLKTTPKVSEVAEQVLTFTNIIARSLNFLNLHINLTKQIDTWQRIEDLLSRVRGYIEWPEPTWNTKLIWDNNFL